jgi:hypothetical protein
MTARTSLSLRCLYPWYANHAIHTRRIAVTLQCTRARASLWRSILRDATRCCISENSRRISWKWRNCSDLWSISKLNPYQHEHKPSILCLVVLLHACIGAPGIQHTQLQLVSMVTACPVHPAALNHCLHPSTVPMREQEPHTLSIQLLFNLKRLMFKSHYVVNKPCMPAGHRGAMRNAAHGHSHASH